MSRQLTQQRDPDTHGAEFEGSSLEPLLEKVQRELGPNARIVKADRLRQGGFLGFFAREHFRLGVEVIEPTFETSSGEIERDTSDDDDPFVTDDGIIPTRSTKLQFPLAQTPLSKPQAPGIRRVRSQVLRANSAGERLGMASKFTSGPPSSIRNEPEDRPPSAGSPASDSEILESGKLTDETLTSLADATTDFVDLYDPVPSTETEPFAAVLGRVASAMEPEVAVTRSTIDAAPPASSQRAQDVVPPATSSANAAPTPPVETAAGTCSASPAEHGPGMALDHPSSTAPMFADEMFQAQQRAEAEIQLGNEAQLRSELSQHVDTTQVPAVVEAPIPEPAPEPTALIASPNVPVSPSDPFCDDLATSLKASGLGRTGVQQILRSMMRGRELGSSLVEMFSQLPPPPDPPSQRGSLLAVVGPGGSVRELAVALAEEVGSDPDSIAIAVPDGSPAPKARANLVVRSAVEAAERSRGWRRSDVAIVAIEASVADGRRGWAKHLLNALEPTAVWGVVSGFYKPEDVANWADSLGGIDALAVEELTRTVSPASMLRSGIPVARLDGKRANAERWAAAIEDLLLI